MLRDPRRADGGAMFRRRHGIDAAVAVDDRAVVRERGFRRDGVILEILIDVFRRAFHRIAEAAAAGPAHGVDIAAVLLEVFFAQLQCDRIAVHFRGVAGHIRRLHALENIAVTHERVGVRRRRVAAEHAGRGRCRVTGRQRVLRNHVGVVRDEAAFGRQTAAVLPGAAGIRQLLAVQEQHGKALFRVFDVRQLADRGA